MTAQPGGAEETVLVPDFGDEEIPPLGPENEDENDEFWADWMDDLYDEERVADDLDDARTYEALREVEDHELPPLREVAGDA